MKNQIIKFDDGYTVKICETEISVRNGAGKSGGKCDPLYLSELRADSRPGQAVVKAGNRIEDYLSNNYDFLVRRGNGVEQAVREITAERRTARDAQQAEQKAKQEAAQARERELIEEAKAKLPGLIAQIPAGGVRVSVISTGYFDGQENHRYEADGEALNWDQITMIGWASAIHPGAWNPFWSEGVAYISREKLDAIRSERQAKQQAAQKEAAEKHAARLAKFDEAKTTGQPVKLRSWVETRRAQEGGEWGDYNFVVTEYALPDGSTKQNAVNTY